MYFVIRRDCPARFVHYLRDTTSTINAVEDPYDLTCSLRDAKRFETEEEAARVLAQDRAVNGGWDTGTYTVEKIEVYARAEDSTST